MTTAGTRSGNQMLSRYTLTADMFGLRIRVCLPDVLRFSRGGS
jgi:hypothetical protein